MQAKAVLRLYEELNDHLPPERRKVGFTHAFEDGASVGKVLAAVGVPEQGVDLVLVNGESVDLDHSLRDGDRVSVYPVFESLDISELTRLQGRPLRQLRFAVDTSLPRVATYLRMLGFDALVEGNGGDTEFVEISQQQERVFLTRNHRLLERRGLTRGYRVAAVLPRSQLAEVLARFDLARAVRPFVRCLRCNTLLEQDTEGADVLSRLPREMQAHHGKFRVCPGCGRFYRQGPHLRRMRGFVDQLIRAARTRWPTRV